MRIHIKSCGDRYTGARFVSEIGAFVEAVEKDKETPVTRMDVLTILF